MARCRVWCPKSGQLVHLYDVPDGRLQNSRWLVARALPADDSLPFLGPLKPTELCSRIACGLVDPLSSKPFVVHRIGGIVHVTLEGEGLEQDGGQRRSDHRRALGVMRAFSCTALTGASRPLPPCRLVSFAASATIVVALLAAHAWTHSGCPLQGRRTTRCGRAIGRRRLGRATT